jgi:hypothetical protein
MTNSMAFDQGTFFPTGFNTDTDQEFCNAETLVLETTNPASRTIEGTGVYDTQFDERTGARGLHAGTEV